MTRCLQRWRSSHDNHRVTEIVEINNRGHALTIDNGWRESQIPLSRSSGDSSRRYAESR